METDSLAVANALRYEKIYQQEIGDVLTSCRDILNDRKDASVQHIRRQANELAHTLAKLPCLSRSGNLFYSPPPEDYQQ